MVGTKDSYIDANGNKVVEPVYNGAGGCACGVIGIRK